MEQRLLVRRRHKAGGGRRECILDIAGRGPDLDVIFFGASPLDFLLLGIGGMFSERHPDSRSQQFDNGFEYSLSPYNVRRLWGYMVLSNVVSLSRVGQ
jgi:hypothetical protein